MADLPNLHRTQPDPTGPYACRDGDSRIVADGADGQSLIRLGLSEAFHNKDRRRGYTDRAWGDSFIPSQVTPEQIVEHTLAGKALTAGYFNGQSRTNETFLSMQLFVLDLEAPEVGDVGVAEALASPFVRDHALAVFPSPSSGIVTASNPHGYKRTRVYFLLSEPVEGLERARAIARAIGEASGIAGIDRASFKPAQPYFGSTNRVEAPSINLNAMLPLAEVAAFTYDLARSEMQHALAPKAPTIKPTSAAHFTWLERKATQWVDRALDELASTSPGARHDALCRKAWYLLGLQKGGWPVGDVVSALRQTALAVMGMGRAREIERALRDAERDAPPIEIELPAPKPAKPTRRRHAAPSGARSGAVRVRHVSDDLKPAEIATHPTLLIQGATGTGKSTAVADYINRLADDQYVTAMAQFRLLTSALHQHLEGFSHYEQADGAYQGALGRLKRLVTSLSSLPKFDRRGGIVVIDEITGVLNFLAQSTTFKRDGALTAYRALKILIQSADQLIGMDANLDDSTIRFIEKYRGPVTVKRYQRHEPRGQVTLLSGTTAAICRIEKLLGHQRGQVYATCSSETTASEIAEYFAGLDYRVLKITRDTSNTALVKAATLNRHRERDSYDLIVYDSGLGRGRGYCGTRLRAGRYLRLVTVGAGGRDPAFRACAPGQAALCRRAGGERGLPHADRGGAARRCAVARALDLAAPEGNAGGRGRHARTGAALVGV